jgi:hypothetical protein
MAPVRPAPTHRDIGSTDRIGSPVAARLIRRGRAWMPAGKAAALFLLPAPLLIAVVGALVAGDLRRLACAGGALASLWGAGALTFRALAAEARDALGERLDLPALPLKLLGAVLTALGSALAAAVGGHTAEGALVFAALAAGGHLAFYGRDPKAPRIEVAAVEGIDRAMVVQQLKQAYGRLRSIERAAQAIRVPEFRDRLLRIAGIGRSILGEIERDPRDAARARRFLNLYLASAERVTVAYAQRHADAGARPLEQKFAQLLVEIERTFAEQHRRLIERDLLSLDVDIEVLSARLEREGLG